MSLTIRAEQPPDTAAIDALLRAAFDGAVEADLVAALRAEGAVTHALVAEATDRIVGHILFSRLQLAGPAPLPTAAALAPLAVLPSHQRRGIGATLVGAGIAACEAAGVTAVLVVGDPAYYGRFGFSAATARRFATPYDGPAMQALAFRPLAPGRWQVTYAAAFDGLA